MADWVLGVETEGKPSFFPVLIDSYIGRWLTRYWVVKQKVNHPSFLY